MQVAAVVREVLGQRVLAVLEAVRLDAMADQQETQQQKIPAAEAAVYVMVVAQHQAAQAAQELLLPATQAPHKKQLAEQ
jgi:formate-dependent phosphoribosylglycinamide formyltransferase (GAR transformylase)